MSYERRYLPIGALNKLDQTIDGDWTFTGDVDISGTLDVSGITTFTADHILLEEPAPQLRFSATSASANEQDWITLVNPSGSYRIAAYDDDFQNGVVALSIDRTGNTIDEIQLDATTLDFNGFANFNGDGLNIPAILLESDAPNIGWHETDAATDEGEWRLGPASGALVLRTRNDALNGGQTPLIITRSGADVAEIELNAIEIDINGDMDVSGDLTVGNATITGPVSTTIENIANGGQLILSGVGNIHGANAAPLRARNTIASNDDCRVSLEDDSGDTLGDVGIINNDMYLRNLSHGGELFLRAENTSGTTINFLRGFSDANAVHIGSNAASTVTLLGGKLFLQEISAAGTDAVGRGQLWVKNTSPQQLWFTDDAGTDTRIV